MQKSSERASRHVHGGGDVDDKGPATVLTDGSLIRRRALLAAVRDRLRKQAVVREAERNGPPAPRRRPPAGPRPRGERE
jgi:hypothetical protein